jgi:hypothetical protein
MSEIHSGDAVTIRHLHVRLTKRGKKAVVRRHALGFWRSKPKMSAEAKLALKERKLAIRERKAAIKVAKLQAKAGIIDAKANRLVGKAQQRLARAEGLRAKADAGFFRGAIRNKFAERRNTRAALMGQRHEANTQTAAIRGEQDRLKLAAGVEADRARLDAQLRRTEAAEKAYVHRSAREHEAELQRLEENRKALLAQRREDELGIARDSAVIALEAGKRRAQRAGKPTTPALSAGDNIMVKDLFKETHATSKRPAAKP